MTLSGIRRVCSAGETFDSVALDIYGDEKYACELMNANPALCGVMLFTGGEALELPVVTLPEDSEDANADAMVPATAPWKE